MMRLGVLLALLSVSFILPSCTSQAAGSSHSYRPDGRLIHMIQRVDQLTERLGDLLELTKARAEEEEVKGKANTLTTTGPTSGFASESDPADDEEFADADEASYNSKTSLTSVDSSDYQSALVDMNLVNHGFDKFLTTHAAFVKQFAAQSPKGLALINGWRNLFPDGLNGAKAKLKSMTTTEAMIQYEDLLMKELEKAQTDYFAYLETLDANWRDEGKDVALSHAVMDVHSAFDAWSMEWSSYVDEKISLIKLKAYFNNMKQEFAKGNNKAKAEADRTYAEYLAAQRRCISDNNKEIKESETMKTSRSPVWQHDIQVYTRDKNACTRRLAKVTKAHQEVFGK